MKKGKIFTAFALLLVLAVTVSCSKKAIEDNAPTTVEEIESTTEITTVPNYSLDLSYLKLDQSLEAERSRLSEEDQKLYDEWLEKILQLELIFIPVKSDEEEEHVLKLLNIIQCDYPEIRLFVPVKDADDNTLMVYYDNLWTGYEDLSIEVDFSPKILKNEIDLIERKCNEIISEMPEATDTPGKYKYLLENTCNMTQYFDKSETYIDEDGLEHWKSYYYHVNGPFVYGKGLCTAYAYAYQLLCQRAGLWCACVYGFNHCWNLVKLDNGLTYHVDPTWCDDEWSYDGYNTDYFLLTQEEIEEDHQPSEDSWVATGTTLQ